jgi:hypothetical protein
MTRPRILDTSKADRRNLCHFCPRTAARFEFGESGAVR